MSVGLSSVICGGVTGLSFRPVVSRDPMALAGDFFVFDVCFLEAGFVCASATGGVFGAMSHGKLLADVWRRLWDP